MEGATHSQRMGKRFRLGIKFEELLIVWLSCFSPDIADCIFQLFSLGKNSIRLSHLMSRHSCCATKGSSEACSMV